MTGIASTAKPRLDQLRQVSISGVGLGDSFEYDGTNWANTANNLTATVNPTVNDDIDGGYKVGSRWLNTVSGDFFVCTDNSDGAAVWDQTNLPGVTPAGNTGELQYNNGGSFGAVNQSVVSGNDVTIFGNFYVTQSGSYNGLRLYNTGNNEGAISFRRTNVENGYIKAQADDTGLLISGSGRPVSLGIDGVTYGTLEITGQFNLSISDVANNDQVPLRLDHSGLSLGGGETVGVLFAVDSGISLAQIEGVVQGTGGGGLGSLSIKTQGASGLTEAVAVATDGTVTITPDASADHALNLTSTNPTSGHLTARLNFTNVGGDTVGWSIVDNAEIMVATMGGSERMRIRDLGLLLTGAASGGPQSGIDLTTAHANSSSTSYGIEVVRTGSNSGTGGFTGIGLDATGTFGGSGDQQLMNLQLNGSPMFSVGITADARIAGALSAQSGYYAIRTTGHSYDAATIQANSWGGTKAMFFANGTQDAPGNLVQADATQPTWGLRLDCIADEARFIRTNAGSTTQVNQLIVDPSQGLKIYRYISHINSPTDFLQFWGGQFGNGGSLTLWGNSHATEGWNTRLNTDSITDVNSLYVRRDGNHIFKSVLDAATGDEAALTLNYTVNKATSGNDTGLLINKTDTSSPGSSWLVDFQNGGASRLYVTDDGGLWVGSTGEVAEADSIIVGNASGGTAAQITETYYRWYGDSDTGLQKSGTANTCNLTGGGTNAQVIVNGTDSSVTAVTGGVTALTLDSSQNATFAGNIEYAGSGLLNSSGSSMSLAVASTTRLAYDSDGWYFQPASGRVGVNVDPADFTGGLGVSRSADLRKVIHAESSNGPGGISLNITNDNNCFIGFNWGYNDSGTLEHIFGGGAGSAGAGNTLQSNAGTFIINHVTAAGASSNVWQVDNDGNVSQSSTLDDATGDEVAHTINYTVNKATSGDDTGLLINKTDTASPGTSYLLDAQVGGITQFNIKDDGDVTIGGNPPGSPRTLMVWGAASNIPVSIDSTDPGVFIELEASLDKALIGIDASGYVGFADNGGTSFFKVHHDAPTNSFVMESTGNATFAGDVTLGTAAGNSLWFGDGDTGFQEDIDDRIQTYIAGASVWEFVVDEFRDAGATGPAMLAEVPSTTNPTLIPRRSSKTTGIGSGTTGEMSLITNGVEAVNIDSSQNATFAASLTVDIDTLERFSVVDAGTVTIANFGAGSWAAHETRVGFHAGYGTLSFAAGASDFEIRAAQALDFQTNGTTTALTLDSSQNATFAGNIAVGGGTFTPIAPLHVGVTAGGNPQIKFSNDTTTHVALNGFNIGLIGDTSVHAELWNYETGTIRFGTSNTEAMTIENNQEISFEGAAFNFSQQHTYRHTQGGAIVTLGNGTFLFSPAVGEMRVENGQILADGFRLWMYGDVARNAGNNETEKIRLNNHTARTTVSGTFTNYGTVDIGTATLTHTDTATTFTHAAALDIVSAPVAGTNVTITNAYALRVRAGDAYFGGDVTFGGAATFTGPIITLDGVTPNVRPYIVMTYTGGVDWRIGMTSGGGNGFFIRDEDEGADFLQFADDTGNTTIGGARVTSTFTAKSGGGNTLVLDANQDATFAGDVTLGSETALTNTVNNALTVSHTTTGVAAAGIGVGIEFEVETAAGNNEIGAVIEAVTTDVTATSEDFDMVFNIMQNGSPAEEVMRLSKSTSTVTCDYLRLTHNGGGLTAFQINNTGNGTTWNVGQAGSSGWGDAVNGDFFIGNSTFAGQRTPFITKVGAPDSTLVLDAIGNATFAGDVDVTGGYITRSTATKTNADSPYTVVGADYALFCDATSGSITINLPAASSSTGRTLVVKKTDGSVNSVIIDGSGAETIDGAATATITTQYESITIVCDGTEWWII
jgi:hypothetical protein